MADNVIPLIWFMERWEAVLLCMECHDVAIYTFPESYPINKIECDYCGCKRLTSKIPRSEQY